MGSLTRISILALWALSGCSTPRQLTELVVVVDTDLPIASLASVDLVVTAPDGAMMARTAQFGGPGAPTLPLTFGLQHGAGPLDPVRVNATARLTSGAQIVTSATTGFVAGERRTLRLVLYARCAGQVCGAGMRCGAMGTCESAMIAGSSLPVFDGTLPDRLDAGPGPRDAVPSDAVPSDAPTRDSSSTDSSWMCIANSDCDDRRGCTRVDSCQPGGSGADVHGCVYTARCPGQGCVEPGQCGIACSADATCNNGIYCDGVEVCDLTIHQCTAGPIPCASCTEAGHCGSMCDVDLDGHLSRTCLGDDCDDTNPGVHPGAIERCNALDDDCDMLIDEAPDADTFCASANASGRCSAGACTAGICTAGFADCNGTWPDGCEADLASDRLHCGTCSGICAPTENCVAAACVASAAPAPRFAQTGAGFQDIVANAVAVSAIGDVCVVGTYTGNPHWTGSPGGLILNGFTFPSVFVVCYDRLGHYRWLSDYGGGGACAGLAVGFTGAAGSEDLVIAGTFTSSIDMRNGPPLMAGQGGVFVAGLRMIDGTTHWSNAVGSAPSAGTGTDTVTDLFGDASGFYLVGSTTGTANFVTMSHAGLGGTDAFVASFSPTGAPRWAVLLGGPGMDRANAVAQGESALSQYVAVAGSFEGSINLGARPYNAALQAGFVAILDTATGSVGSSRAFQGHGTQSATAVTIDADDNLYVGGTFDIDVDVAAPTGPLTSMGGNDIFVASYGPTPPLAYRWSRRYGDSGTQGIAALELDEVTNHLYLAGTFDGTIDFVGNILRSGPQAGYLAALDRASGNHRWSRQFGNAPGTATAHDLAVGVNLVPDRIAVCGGYHGNTDFGFGPPPSTGTGDAFVVYYEE